MTNKKQMMKDLINWGIENENNRSEAIDTACRLLSTLYSFPPGKKLSDSDVDLLAGGVVYTPEIKKTPWII